MIADREIVMRATIAAAIRPARLARIADHPAAARHAACTA
jgi:hypothetical protein